MTLPGWGLLALLASACGTSGGDMVDAAVDAPSPDAIIEPPSGPQLWFEEVGAEIGVDFERRPEHGYVHLPDRMMAGVCVLDADGEMPLDLLFTHPRLGDQGSHFYRAAGALMYRDETEAWGLAELEAAYGCLAFDAEGDGDEDLLIYGMGFADLYRNNGTDFSRDSSAVMADFPAQGMMVSAAAGDLDGDGDLDLVVGGFVDYRFEFPPDEECPFEGCPAAVEKHDPIRNYILIQTDTGSFEDRTEALSRNMMAREPTLVLTISQLDGQGGPDIYIGNDLGNAFQDHPLRADDSGIFWDVGPGLGMNQDRAGRGIDTMGFAHADLNGDGVMDHAASNFEGMATPVFICLPDTGCSDRSVEWGTHELADTFRWGLGFADFNLDGWPDLFEATGHVYLDPELEHYGSRMQMRQRQNVFQNWRGETFYVVDPPEDNALAGDYSARGIAIADLDDDGAPDVVLATTEGSPLILRNVLAMEGHWLRIRLEGRAPNTGAVGARVEVSSGGRTQIRERVAGEGFLGNFDPRLHFGFSGADPVQIEVQWPDGTRSVHPDVELDRELVLSQP